MTSLYIPLTKSDYSAIELWEYKGGLTTPAKKWTLPAAATSMEADSIFHDATRNRLIVNTMDYYSPNTNKRSWEWDFTNAAPTQLKAAYNDGSNYDVATDALLWNGYYYALHSGQDNNPAFLARYDPTNPETTYSVSLELSCVRTPSPPQTSSEGGLAVLGSYLYCIFPDHVYRSTTGASGSWELVADMWGTYNAYEITGAVYDSFTGNIYFGAMRFAGGSYYRTIWMVNGTGVTKEYEELLGTTQLNYLAVTAIGCPGDAQPVGVQWLPRYGIDPPPFGHDIFRRQSDGTWVIEETFYPYSYGSDADDQENTTTLAKQNAFFYEGKLHVFMDGYNYSQSLWRREAIGNWRKVQKWIGYIDGLTYHYGGSMGLAPSTPAGRTLCQLIKT